MSDSLPFTITQYAAICDSLPDPTFILTESGRYAAVLGGKDNRYYHDGSSLVGKYLKEVLAPAKAQWFLEQIQQTIRSQHMLVLEYELSGHDVLGLPTDGPVEPIWFEGRIMPLQHIYAGERAVVWVASNITQSKQMQRQLHQQAMSDELTGLHNRRHFILALDQAYTAFTQQGTPACVIYFDVDGFKSINDNLGHAAGDRALCDLAKLAQGLVGPEHEVCRLGGDEFVVLCQEVAMDTIMALAQKLLQSARSVLQAYASATSVPSLSLGISHFKETDTSMQDVLLRADQALYVSKTHGGHQVSAGAL